MGFQAVELSVSEPDREDFVRALKFIRTHQNASPALIRRSLGIRLIRIMNFLEVMEAAELIGPYHSIITPRDIHIPKSGGH